jgi:diguanylate cyclase
VFAERVDDLAVAATVSSLTNLLSQVGESVVHADRDLVIRYCNDVYARSIGRSIEDTVGRSAFDIQPNFDRSIFYKTFLHAHKDREIATQVGYSTFMQRWVVMRAFPVADGGTLMMTNDASNAAVRQHQLAQSAIKDALTGLPNKIALMQELEVSLNLGEALELLVFGLDRFKNVNDEVGFGGGDMALLGLASRLQSATRAGERLFRLTGDEFALLASHDAVNPWRAAVAMLASSQEPVLVAGQAFVLGATAGGVATRVDEVVDAETLLRRASLALREGKRRARGRVTVFDPSLEEISHRRARLESDLRVALKNGDLTLVFQPQGTLSTGDIVGAEALVRWKHPTLGMLSPGEFLPIAQESGLMVALDQIVLEIGMRAIVEMRARGLNLPVSFNLSVESLAESNMAERLTSLMRATGVGAELVQVEIPENALMRDVATSAATLEKLSAMGVRISVDDFGTGYSSFAYLARFPVSALKIDRSFVKNLPTNAAGRKIVRGIARLAHSLNLEVIAEGAETREEMAMLRMMDCDQVQGYGYAKPMPLDDFVAFACSHLPRDRISELTL